MCVWYVRQTRIVSRFNNLPSKKSETIRAWELSYSDWHIRLHSIHPSWSYWHISVPCYTRSQYSQQACVWGQSTSFYSLPKHDIDPHWNESHCIPYCHRSKSGKRLRQILIGCERFVLFFNHAFPLPWCRCCLVYIYGVSIQCIQGTFDTSVVKVILWSLGAFSDFRQFCILKMAGCTAKWIKTWAPGMNIQWIQDTCEKPCVSKTAGFRVKDTSRSQCYPVYVVIVFNLVKQSAKPVGFLFNCNTLS